MIQLPFVSWPLKRAFLFTAANIAIIAAAITAVLFLAR